MTTSTTLIQRAAELVIAFGLEHTGMTPAGVRDAGNDSGLIVLWRSPGERSRVAPEVELVVRRLTDRVEARIYTCGASGLRIDDARQFNALHGRVVDLAERIEALR